MAGCFLASSPGLTFLSLQLSLTCSPLLRIALSFPVTTFISVLLMPETLASAILRKKAAKLNKEAVNTGKRFVAPSELKQESAWVEYVSMTCRDALREATAS